MSWEAALFKSLLHDKPLIRFLSIALVAGIGLQIFLAVEVHPRWQILALWVPALAVLSLGASGFEVISNLRRHPFELAWMAFGLVLGMVPILIAWAVAAWLDQSAVFPFVPSYFVSAFLATFSSALGEEIGWRGFLMPHLSRRFDLLTAAGLTAVVWFFFKAPLLFFRLPQSEPVSWISLAAAVLALSYALAWLRLRTRDIWPCAFLHGFYFSGAFENDQIAFSLSGLIGVLLFGSFFAILLARKTGSESSKSNWEASDSEGFLNSVIENIPNMIFVKDARDLRFVRFNRAGEQLIGVDRKDMIGKTDYDFFPKSEADFFTEQDRQVLQKGLTVDIPEEELTTKSGVRYLHTKKIPILDRRGKPTYLLGISEDITDKKKIEDQTVALAREQAARAQTEKLLSRMTFLAQSTAALTESLDLPVMLQSFANRIVEYMADWVQIDVLTESGEQFEHHIGAPMGRSFEKLDLSLLNESKLEERMMQIAIKAQDRILGVIRIGLNGDRCFDEVDYSFADDLGRRAFFAIENSRLFVKAQDANRAKTAFLANVSHEIRTPLGAMLGFAEVLQESGFLNPEQRESVETIIRNGQALLRIVDEILDISKVESDRIDLENIRFSLPQLLKDVVELLAIRAQEKNVGLEVVYGKDIPVLVNSDPTRLRQILMNVVGNAIKFTDRGTVRIDVNSIPDLSSRNRTLQIRVKDSGIGISEEQAARLFHPFSQADSSMTRRFGGTGLGLFLARRLARLLGGDVVLEASHPGLGSQFLITLKMTVEEQNPKVRELRPAPTLAVASRGSVLIVDDSADNRELILLFLKRLGWSGEAAAGGQEALDVLRKKKFEVVLMDLQMPGMDGFQTLLKLRSEGYQGPVVALTAHTMKGDRERCLKAGFDDYLAKPVSRDQLQHSLARFFAQLTEKPESSAVGT